VQQRHRVLANRLDLAFALMARGRRCRLVVEAGFQALEAGFRINQELRRHHHALSGGQAFADFGLPARLSARFHLDRAKAPTVLRQHDHGTPPGGDQGFGGYQHRRRAGPVHELQGHEHARCKRAAGVGQLNPGPDGTRGGAHLGQQRLDRTLEHGAGRSRTTGLYPCTRAHQRGLAFGDFGQRPDAGQSIDACEQHARAHRHAFARDQFGHHAATGHTQRGARLDDPRRLHTGDLLNAHAQLPHALACRGDQRITRPGRCLEREELPLRGDPFGHVQIGERLAGAHRVQRGAHVQPLDEPGSACLHNGLVPLVPRNVADR
jgi:hypothetical protein